MKRELDKLIGMTVQANLWQGRDLPIKINSYWLDPEANRVIINGTMQPLDIPTIPC